MKTYLKGQLTFICPDCQKEQTKEINLNTINGKGYYDSGVCFECYCGLETDVTVEFNDF